ncbi:30S ribosomal protein S5 alanine N-acetyltransferase, partial [Photobacterium damselae]
MFHSIINRSSTIVVDELKIRLVTCKDAENIAIYYQKNRSHLQPWEPTREENFFTVAGWEKRLEQIAILHRHEMAYYFIVTPRHSNQVLAVIN